MNQPQRAADVEQLLQLCASGPPAMADLDDCVRRLREVEDAKSALAQLPSKDLRQAIAHRHRCMRDPGSRG